MKKYITNKYTLTVFGVVLFFLLWCLISLIVEQHYGIESKFIFPNPFIVIEEAFSYFKDPYLYKCIWGSFYRMLIGFGVGSILGIVVGMIVGNFIKIKYVFNPTIIALRSVPTAALIFLLLVIVGFEHASLYLVILIVFPMVYESTVSGYQNIDEQMLMAMRVDGANPLSKNFKVKLPLSMPYIATGLISSFALSFKVEIMAEVITSSSKFYGLGRAIAVAFGNQSNGLVSTFAFAFIAILVMMLVSLIIWIIKKAFHIKSPGK